MKKSLSLLSASTALLLGLSAFQASAQEPQTPSADAPGITQDVNAPEAAETAEAPVTPVQEEAEKDAPGATDTTSESAAPQTDETPAATVPTEAQEEVATPVETQEKATAPVETQEKAVAPVETKEEAVAPTAVEEAAPASQPAKAVVKSPLTGTSWGLVRIESGDGTVLKPKYSKNFAITFIDDKTVAVRINCNDGKSSWVEKESQALELAPLAMTRKACPTVSPIDERMFKDWEYVRHYIIEKGRLHMSLQADAGTYEFRPLKK